MLFATSVFICHDSVTQWLMTWQWPKTTYERCSFMFWLFEERLKNKVFSPLAWSREDHICFYVTFIWILYFLLYSVLDPLKIFLKRISLISLKHLYVKMLIFIPYLYKSNIMTVIFQILPTSQYYCFIPLSPMWLSTLCLVLFCLCWSWLAIICCFN